MVFESSTDRGLDLQSCASVFLFDFDDTLLPTTALGQLEQLDDFDGDLESPPAMRHIDALASSILEEATRLPRSLVILLTNACERWVWKSAAMHLPKVYGLLMKQSVYLVSAHRDMDGPPCESEEEELLRQIQHVQTSVSWKDETVRNIVSELRDEVEAMRPFDALQVVAMGDSPHDIKVGRTLLDLVAGSEASYLKTVKMQPTPTVKHLEAELRLVANAFPRLCRKPRNVVCSMQPTMKAAGKTLARDR
eukprot:TRINITY_DN16701_c0_g1_i2.p1 TRINITY_DN16701_c0_g1~~TRINITY_DN16701_c0_g1_i2.p1  ORF type:complete len:250 (+),score=54.88 TRINITY_DN16701_c0_g1_i2:187-936(+)